MMKKEWTYKKLGEVGTIIGGSTPKTDNPDFWDGDLAWITPAELDGSKYVNSTVRTITEKAVEKANLTLLPIGTVLLSSRAPIGKVCITKIPMYCNQGFKNIVCSDELNNEYLYWWLKRKNEYLNTLGVGATFKEISKRIVEQITIPVPPLETQSQIVSELDLLQSIIDKQKAQLKELDNLAQAVFYDMFGDPVSNEKGWEVKKLGDVCETTSGGTPSKNHPEYYEGGTIPWLRSGEVSKGFIYHTELFITEEGLKNSSAKMVPVNSVAIAMYGATVGQVGIIKSSMCTNQAICCIFPNDTFIPIFLYFFLLSKKSEYLKVAVGGAQPNISQSVIKQTLIGIPPIHLQQQFAEMIESIEKQKAAINKSIAESQKLFDYTMDKYFG